MISCAIVKVKQGELNWGRAGYWLLWFVIRELEDISELLTNKE